MPKRRKETNQNQQNLDPMNMSASFPISPHEFDGHSAKLCNNNHKSKKTFGVSLTP